jgi:hypothetical protein
MACSERIAGGLLTRSVVVNFDPEDRVVPLEVRAELAAADEARHRLARARARAATSRGVGDAAAGVSEVCADVNACPIVKRHRRQQGILGKRGLRAAQRGNHGSERGRNTHDPDPKPQSCDPRSEPWFPLLQICHKRLDSHRLLKTPQQRDRRRGTAGRTTDVSFLLVPELTPVMSDGAGRSPQVLRCYQAMRVRLVAEGIVLRPLNCSAAHQLLADLPRMRWHQSLSSITQWIPVHLAA